MGREDKIKDYYHPNTSWRAANNCCNKDGTRGERLSGNELASVHGKDVERLMNEMLTTKSDFGKDNLKYVNKEIAMQWLGIAPPEGAASLTDAQQSTANIIQNFQNPKIEA